MKKVVVTLVIAVSSLCISDCEHSVDYTRGEFGLYLLAADTVTAVEAAPEPLDALMLSPKPIISIEDITYYRWSDHGFALKSGSDRDLRSIVKRHLTVRGIPFLLVADNQRIYLGTFWFAYSSIVPPCPFINGAFAFFDSPLCTLKIEQARVDSQADVRNDPRIYRALLAAGVLIE